MKMHHERPHLHMLMFDKGGSVMVGGCSICGKDQTVEIPLPPIGLVPWLKGEEPLPESVAEQDRVWLEHGQCPDCFSFFKGDSPAT